MVHLPSQSAEEESLRRIVGWAKACSRAPCPRATRSNEGGGHAPLRDALPTLRKVAYQPQPRKQSADREPNRQHNVERGQAELAALVVQRDVERECREGRVAAEDPGSEEQAPVL